MEWNSEASIVESCKKLEIMDKILVKSRLTEENALEIWGKVNKEIAIHNNILDIRKEQIKNKNPKP